MARRTFAYECRYCGKLFRSWDLAERHERSCLKNPDSINCIKCKYYNPNYQSKQKDGTIKTVPTCILHIKRCSKAVSGNCSDFIEVDVNE